MIKNKHVIDSKIDLGLLPQWWYNSRERRSTESSPAKYPHQRRSPSVPNILSNGTLPAIEPHSPNSRPITLSQASYKPSELHQLPPTLTSSLENPYSKTHKQQSPTSPIILPGIRCFITILMKMHACLLGIPRPTHPFFWLTFHMLTSCYKEKSWEKGNNEDVSITYESMCDLPFIKFSNKSVCSQ